MLRLACGATARAVLWQCLSGAPPSLVRGTLAARDLGPVSDGQSRS